MDGLDAAVELLLDGATYGAPHMDWYQAYETKGMYLSNVTFNGKKRVDCRSKTNVLN